LIVAYVFLLIWTLLTAALGLYTFKRGFDYIDLLEKEPDIEDWYDVKLSVSGGLLFFVCLAALLVAMSHLVVLSHFINCLGAASGRIN
jgi:hypothetical protein